MSKHKRKYRMRIPSISIGWLYEVYATSEDEALKKVVKKINSKTVDYSDKSCWEIIEIESPPIKG